MGNRLTNDSSSGGVPGLRVAPALATLLLLLLCLQVCWRMRHMRCMHRPPQVLINPTPFPSTKRDKPDTLLKASTTTTRMVIKDTRRLYARRQQVVVDHTDHTSPHDTAPVDDPFEPRLDLQLRSWYQWLTAHSPNSTFVPDGVPSTGASGSA